ncbi:hypothetical protein BC831DRAFT_157619 [Entophlyctis helioformis]|nr:hypothetical protein BC831DRAFT_157619 [Entophlyctis helioformis]
MPANATPSICICWERALRAWPASRRHQLSQTAAGMAAVALRFPPLGCHCKHRRNRSRWVKAGQGGPRRVQAGWRRHQIADSRTSECCQNAGLLKDILFFFCNVFGEWHSRGWLGWPALLRCRQSGTGWQHTHTQTAAPSRCAQTVLARLRWRSAMTTTKRAA